jgi:hypothetical protein
MADAPQERAGLGRRRERAVRLLLAGLAAAVVINLGLFARAQTGDQRLRLRSAADVETLAARAPSRAVRNRHGTYYRLARELRGATVHMDRTMADRHRWALEGLGDWDVKVARRLIKLGGPAARPLVEAATWSGQLEARKLHLVADPAERTYVMAWVGRGERARILVVPLSRFRAAGGKL